MNKIFVIIVTYNARKWVDKCLGSLRESTIKCYLVVIDNCSKDETVTYIQKRYPEAHIIINQKNRGFGYANNQGIEYAYNEGATHYFLLNQDAWVSKDTISRLVQVQNDNNIALVSPIHLNGTGDDFDINFFSSAIKNELENKFIRDLTLQRLLPYYKIHFVNAAAWLLNRQTIETIGGFDPVFFHYGEDVNYLHRLSFHHKEVVFVPNAFINHDRKRFGNEKVSNMRATISALLSIYCNINKPLIHPCNERFKLHCYYIIKFLISLFTFKFSDARYIVKGYVQFIKLLPRIITNRKENKSIGALWLNLCRKEI